MDNPMKINLGCGPHGLAGWTNIDIDPPNDPICTYRRFDLSLGLPADILAGSVDLIYTEHFVEHLTRDAFFYLLSHCKAAMRRGAIMRVSTPDLDYLISRYLAGEVGDWSPTWNPQTPCQMLNEGVRLWGHQFIYNLSEMRRIVADVGGFSDPRRCAWRVSTEPQLSNLEVRPYVGDLIVEFQKL